MSDHDRPASDEARMRRKVERLVARCLDAGVEGYRGELERLAAANPRLAADLRKRIAILERLGWLAGPPIGAEGEQG